ncbi:hypothetical protein K6Y82_20965 [Burkholderia cenocepacia]
MVADGNPIASAYGIAFRRIKLEYGTTNTLYSSEGSSIYLQSETVGAGASAYSNVTSSRAIGTVYTNSTPRPLFVIVEVGMPATQNAAVVFRVNGLEVGVTYNPSGVGGLFGTLAAIVPAGATYQVANAAGTFSLSNWNEF